MLTISKPLSASQAQTYHKTEFANAEQRYYTQTGQVCGEWQGRLADQWGLHGEVQEEQFQRLAEGQHPLTGEQLVRYQQAREYVNESGEKVKTMEHRAGWDATFSAPKSVSLTALVGGDERVREAHRESVRVAVDEAERYVQARIGGNAPAETTGKWAAAKFEHDSSRPVEGYAAPQLHTHVVFFNVTETEDGKAHAIQPKELYRTQQYATAVYRSELAWRLRELGYEVESGKSCAPEIRGYTANYLEASSPRSQQIKEHLEGQGRSGAGAAQIAAHRTRDAKQQLGQEETVRRHREMASNFGNQPDRIVQAAKERMQALDYGRDRAPRSARAAVTFARDRNLEREAVVDERSLMRDALKRSMGDTTFQEVKAHFEQRVQSGDLIQVNTPIGRSFTTPEMMRLESETLDRMRAGQSKCAPLVPYRIYFENLSSSQRQAVGMILENRDQIMGLEGAAGTGKTTSLAAIREAVEREGYQVEGFAPTSRAAHQLEEAGIAASTLQHHLAGGERSGDGGKHLYFVDESSLASTKQMRDFLARLKENDRVLLVGDTRQHQGVDAGKPYEQLQEAGMRTARLEEIVRQKEPGLKEVVENLARGEVREGVAKLDQQGRVHEIRDRSERLHAIAQAYAAKPDSTLVISPDNKSRMELNQAIHREQQKHGHVDGAERRLTVLVPRQDMTGADRQSVAQYEAGDVLRYVKGSRAMRIGAGEYAQVESFDRNSNLLTVRRGNGESFTYDPRRLQGVTVYRESERRFADGERVQFTAPDKGRRIANRELGTIESIDERGNIQIKLDSGRELLFNIKQNPHLDYGYAVTSHSSQGATADRVLIHIDSEAAHEKLINSRLAYVAVSRARYDAQIYTNDAGNLGKVLSREVSHTAAISEVQQSGPEHGRMQQQRGHRLSI